MKEFFFINDGIIWVIKGFIYNYYLLKYIKYFKINWFIMIFLYFF